MRNYITRTVAHPSNLEIKTLYFILGFAHMMDGLVLISTLGFFSGALVYKTTMRILDARCAMRED